jgi:hypothetical protein
MHDMEHMKTEKAFVSVCVGAGLENKGCKCLSVSGAMVRERDVTT